MGRITAGVAPVWAWQNGGFAAAIVHTGVGDWNITLQSPLAATECVILCQPAEAQVASGLRSFGVVHTSATVKQLTNVLEGGAGADSAASDACDVDVLVLARGPGPQLYPGRLHSLGSLDFPAGVPTWTWLAGGFSNAAPTDNAAGDTTVALVAGHHVAGNESIVMITPRVALAAAGLRSAGYTRPGAGTLRITTGIEAALGAASTIADVPVDVGIWSLY